MSIIAKLKRLVEDPPPEFLFEFSEAGIAWAHRAKTQSTGFEPLEPGVISPSPVRDNVLQPERLEEAIFRLAPPAAQRRRTAAVLLPDYCGRVAVLDFDSFPSEPQEQMALVRFRVKKSVPFDLDAASVSFQVQPHRIGGKKRDVVVAVVSHEILARYEAPLRAAGLHPGFVTISALAALNLVSETSLVVTAKLSGLVLSVAVTENNALRMFRCVELEEVSTRELTGVLFPTYAYIEDEMQTRPSRLLLCGFGPFGEALTADLERELNTRVSPLRSVFGAPGPFNAGLLGYLQTVGMEMGEAA
ncbi:MAG: hypothetical protein NZV14_14805 [Bryobacteraceae bacterium]|nr:hypothetical protein [Bryobacteraceae bacterium]MDW8379433.1 hypothetical protein [Bryobacterales bacterium]